MGPSVSTYSRIFNLCPRKKRSWKLPAAIFQDLALSVWLMLVIISRKISQPYLIG